MKPTREIAAWKYSSWKRTALAGDAGGRPERIIDLLQKMCGGLLFLRKTASRASRNKLEITANRFASLREFADVEVTSLAVSEISGD